MHGNSLQAGTSCKPEASARGPRPHACMSCAASAVRDSRSFRHSAMSESLGRKRSLTGLLRCPDYRTAPQDVAGLSTARQRCLPLPSMRAAWRSCLRRRRRRSRPLTSPATWPTPPTRCSALHLPSLQRMQTVTAFLKTDDVSAWHTAAGHRQPQAVKGAASSHDL